MQRVSTSQTIRREGRAITARWLRASAILAGLAVFTPLGEASTNLFINSGTACTATSPCNQAATFGLLIGLGTAIGGVGGTGRLIETGGATDNLTGQGNGGDIGIGAGSLVVTSGGGGTATWTGPVDFADACSPTCSTTNTFSVPSATDNLTHVTIIGGTTTGNSTVTTALSQVLSMSTYWSAASGQTSLGTLTGGTTIGTVGAGVQVFTVNSINLSSTLTIRGGANDIVVINDANSAFFKAGGNVVLTGGITVDQVLFNITGTGNNILSIVGGGGGNKITINGDIIVRGSYSATNATVDGRILGGWNTISLGANFAEVIPSDSGTPEPSTWFLMLGGFAGLFYFGRKMPGNSRLPMSARFRARMKADADGPTGDLPPVDCGAASGSGRYGAPSSEPGIPAPRDGGDGASAGVDCARLK